jgi:hypothetical protein
MTLARAATPRGLLWTGRDERKVGQPCTRVCVRCTPVTDALVWGPAVSR